MYIMNMQICGKLAGHTNLLSRIQETCMKYNVSFLRYLLDKSYANKVKSDIRKQYCEPDGQWRPHRNVDSSRVDSAIKTVSSLTLSTAM